MGISSKYIVFIAILVLVILVSGCISNDEIVNNNISSNSTNTRVKSYSTDDFSFQYPGNWHLASYDEAGKNIELSKDPFITFYLLNFGFQLSPSMYSPKFQILVIPNKDIPIYDPYYGTSDDDLMISNNGNYIHGDVLIENGNSIDYTSIPTNNNLSEQKIIDIMRNDTDIFGTKISSKTIQIDGKTAYEDVFILNSAFPPIIDRKFVQILFVKNDITYLMIFDAQEWDYDKERKNFDIILNSFRVN